MGKSFEAKILSFWSLQTFPRSRNSRGKNPITQAKNSRFQQIHLVYLPKIGRIKKPAINYLNSLAYLDRILLKKRSVKTCFRRNPWNWPDRLFHPATYISPSRIDSENQKLNSCYSLSMCQDENEDENQSFGLFWNLDMTNEPILQCTEGLVCSSKALSRKN